MKKSFRSTLLCLFLTFFLPQAQSLDTIPQETENYEYFICACAIFNNDAPWLREWIEYHKLIGIQHFFLYNNESDDNYLEALQPYRESGDVTLIEWPNRHIGNEIHAWVWGTQSAAIMDAIDRLKGRSKWLAIIDTDEFIVPITSDNMVNFLQDYSQYGALFVHWDWYGTSDYWDIPKGKLMIESLTRKTAEFHHRTYFGKSIVRPEFVTEPIWAPHIYKLSHGLTTVEPDGSLFQHGITRSLDKIKLNHYTVRTLNFFWNEKLPRREKMSDKPFSREEAEAYLMETNYREDPTKEIFRFIPELKKKMKIEEKRPFIF